MLTNCWQKCISDKKVNKKVSKQRPTKSKQIAEKKVNKQSKISQKSVWKSKQTDFWLFVFWNCNWDFLGVIWNIVHGKDDAFFHWKDYLDQITVFDYCGLFSNW